MNDPQVDLAVQPHSHTGAFRERTVLEAACKALPALGRRPRILSFGCSIGYEPLTLRFLHPEAEVLGCDISPPALRVAREFAGEHAEIFRSDADEIFRRGPYDLICAMSSLCINPAPPNIAAAFPFARFDALISFLADCLTPGGLFAFTNMSYLFRHTSVAGAFDAVRNDVVYRNSYIDLFAPDGRRLIERSWSGSAAFQRVNELADLDDWDLIDSIFRKRPAGEAPALLSVSTRCAPYEGEAMSWSISDLAMLQPDGRAGCIEVIHTDRFYRVPSGHLAGERTTSRSRLRGGAPLLFGPGAMYFG